MSEPQRKTRLPQHTSVRNPLEQFIHILQQAAPLRFGEPKVYLKGRPPLEHTDLLLQGVPSSPEKAKLLAKRREVLTGGSMGSPKRVPKPEPEAMGRVPEETELVRALRAAKRIGR